MKTIILIIALAMTGCAGKQIKGICTQIESKNDLELCEFQQATLVLSRGGMTAIPKASPSPSPVKPVETKKK